MVQLIWDRGVKYDLRDGGRFCSFLSEIDINQDCHDDDDNHNSENNTIDYRDTWPCNIIVIAIETDYIMRTRR